MSVKPGLANNQPENLAEAIVFTLALVTIYAIGALVLTAVILSIDQVSIVRGLSYTASNAVGIVGIGITLMILPSWQILSHELPYLRYLFAIIGLTFIVLPVVILTTTNTSFADAPDISNLALFLGSLMLLEVALGWVRAWTGLTKQTVT